MDHDTSLKFQNLLDRLNEKFGGDGNHDLNSVLFIVGVQEVGKGFKMYSKDEKMNLMHVAICTILEPFGFYKFERNDEEGWPHFQALKKLPALSLQEQEELLKEAALNYFIENNLVDLSN